MVFIGVISAFGYKVVLWKKGIITHRPAISKSLQLTGAITKSSDYGILLKGQWGFINLVS